MVGSALVSALFPSFASATTPVSSATARTVWSPDAAVHENTTAADPTGSIPPLTRTRPATAPSTSSRTQKSRAVAPWLTFSTVAVSSTTVVSVMVSGSHVRPVIVRSGRATSGSCCERSLFVSSDS